MYWCVKHKGKCVYVWVGQLKLTRCEIALLSCSWDPWSPLWQSVFIVVYEFHRVKLGCSARVSQKKNSRKTRSSQNFVTCLSVCEVRGTSLTLTTFVIFQILSSTSTIIVYRVSNINSWLIDDGLINSWLIQVRKDHYQQSITDNELILDNVDIINKDPWVHPPFSVHFPPCHPSVVLFPPFNTAL